MSKDFRSEGSVHYLQYKYMELIDKVLYMIQKIWFKYNMNKEIGINPTILWEDKWGSYMNCMTMSKKGINSEKFKKKVQ